MFSNSLLCIDQEVLKDKISDFLCDEKFLHLISKPPMVASTTSCKESNMMETVNRLVQAMVKVVGEC